MVPRKGAYVSEHRIAHPKMHPESFEGLKELASNGHLMVVQWWFTSLDLRKKNKKKRSQLATLFFCCGFPKRSIQSNCLPQDAWHVSSMRAGRAGHRCTALALQPSWEIKFQLGEENQNIWGKLSSDNFPKKEVAKTSPKKRWGEESSTNWGGEISLYRHLRQNYTWPRAPSFRFNDCVEKQLSPFLSVQLETLATKVSVWLYIYIIYI